MISLFYYPRHLRQLSWDHISIIRISCLQNCWNSLRSRQIFTRLFLPFPAAFAGLLYLRELDLSNNSLQHFQYGVLEDLYFLRQLSLGGNPWVCDYNIHYLVYWLKHHPGVLYTGLTCSEPLEFRGWRVEDYVKTYNGECPIDKQTGGGADRGQGGTNVEAQEVVVAGDRADGDGDRPAQPLRKTQNEKFEIIRLS